MLHARENSIPPKKSSLKRFHKSHEAMNASAAIFAQRARCFSALSPEPAFRSASDISSSFSITLNRTEKLLHAFAFLLLKESRPFLHLFPDYFLPKPEAPADFSVNGGSALRLFRLIFREVVGKNFFRGNAAIGVRGGFADFEKFPALAGF